MQVIYEKLIHFEAIERVVQVGSSPNHKFRKKRVQDILLRRSWNSMSHQLFSNKQRLLNKKKILGAKAPMWVACHVMSTRRRTHLRYTFSHPNFFLSFKYEFQINKLSSVNCLIRLKQAPLKKATTKPASPKKKSVNS